MKKQCKNCKWFIEAGGRDNLGLCISVKSQKKNKDIILKKDICKRWELKNEIR